MDDLVIRKYVENFLSDEVNEDYLTKYLNNYEIQKKCDEMISNLLKEDISNNNYNIDKYLNYLNNVASKLLNKKPYLLEFNVITNTLNELVEKNKSKYFDADKRQENDIAKEIVEIIKLQGIISEEFTDKQEFDIEAEEKMAHYYLNKINNNENLLLEELEEMLSFNLYCHFIVPSLVESDLDLFDVVNEYALKIILKNNYKINEYLYKNLFTYFCNRELINIDNNSSDKTFKLSNNLIIYFTHEKDSKYNMQFGSDNDKLGVIKINNSSFFNQKPLENFISFFHEITHYEQLNPKDFSVKSFLISKDLFIRQIMDENYYDSNYKNLSFEKDAMYKSYEKAFKFFEKIYPDILPELKNYIHKRLMVNMLLESDDIHERNYNGKVEDVNILFEKIAKENRPKFLKEFANKLTSPILIEYDVKGNKRNLFELLEDKKYREDNGLGDRLMLTNYLLYEESVSFEYILDNLRLLDNKEIKSKYSEFIPEVKQILKHKLSMYYANYFSKKKDKSKFTPITKFYDTLIEHLRAVNIKGLSKDKNVELYRTKEDELRIAYKWLYELASEIEEEMVIKMLTEDKKR